MVWRGTTTVSDRIFACLAYLLALMDLIVLVLDPLRGSFLAPIVNAIAIPLMPLILIYAGIPLLSFIVFLVLFALIVRNENIRHFIRYNVMQSILFGIVFALVGLFWQYILLPILSSGLLVQTLFNTIFLGGLAAIAYSVVLSAMGKYAEIPTLSEAVYSQVR